MYYCVSIGGGGGGDRPLSSCLDHIDMLALGRCGVEVISLEGAAHPTKQTRDPAR